MTSIQAWAAQVLDDALPDAYIVRGYLWAPDGAEPGRTYVSVYRTLAEPGGVQGARRHELTVDVMTSITDPAKADAALDAAVHAVLTVIETDDDFEGLTWTRADRTVNGDQQYPGYSISTWCISTKETENPEEP
ncbi:hypothetical protein [Jiangella sp. DSM 45060]|uniref:hypothetical protein n=1 Tax=Jiangella sp. DSM 45060 TaxID=1798224 RepID=UPI00087C7AC2|nr:hypothetical protein [Jiangella sp. DSM 45060]SDT69473.1 hypothetical protein SAMN04515669_6026 [Jiangella sp. DSM 45060]